MDNIFANLPDDLSVEHFDDLVNQPDVRIERIVSFGQSSPAKGWYDQGKNEWVMVLSGAGTIVFENGAKYTLNKGDYLTIPAHTKHKVTGTASNQPTIWLAVFY